MSVRRQTHCHGHLSSPPGITAVSLVRYAQLGATCLFAPTFFGGRLFYDDDDDDDDDDVIILMNRQVAAHARTCTAASTIRGLAILRPFRPSDEHANHSVDDALTT